MIAIVPARGGSKGLPRKNIKILCGKPMIAYVIEEGLKSQYLDEIIVSTDDKEIANIAIQYGAKCPFLRPAELATDDVRPIEAYIYTIEKLKQEFDYQIEHFTVLQPTSPLLITEDIDRAIELFYEKNADSIISYTEEQHPLSWHKYITSDYRFEHIFGQELSNRQASRKTYYCTGSVMVFRYALMEGRTFYTPRSFAYILPQNRAVDVDTIGDFEYAEYLLKRRLLIIDE